MVRKSIAEFIVADPKIMFGKPVVKGTRVPVDLILEKLADGESIAHLLKAYPRVSKAAIYACLYYASLSVKNELSMEIA